MSLFDAPTHVVFGPGSLQELSAQLVAYPGNVLLVCEGAVMRATDILDRALAALEPAGRQVAVFEGVQPNPTTDNVRAGMALAQAHDARVIIGLGGGSSIDTAKAIAVGVTHPEHDVWEYLINRIPVTAATLPIIAITTTSGTGSQMTPYAVTTNPETNEKPGMTSVHIIPKVAIVDPELMLTVPKGVTASTGIDVLTHCIEAYTSTWRGGLADANAWAGIELVAEYLPIALADGGNLEARSMLALADTHAGIAIANQGVTLAHSLAHAISGHFDDIPHGLALVSIYPAVLAANAPGCPDRHAKIARALANTDDIVAAFSDFAQRAGVSNLLAAKQPDATTLNAIADGALDYMAGCVDLNPVPVTKALAQRILHGSTTLVTA